MSTKEDIVFSYWVDSENRKVCVGYRIDEDADILEYVLVRKNPKDVDDRRIARHFVREGFADENFNIISRDEIVSHYSMCFNYCLRKRVLNKLSSNSFNHVFYKNLLSHKLNLLEDIF